MGEQTQEWPPGSAEVSVEEINRMLADETIREQEGAARLARHKRLSHTGKVKYMNEAAAEVEAKRLESASDSGEKMRVYRCQFCHMWHVGHTPGSPRPKKLVELLLHVTGDETKVLGYKHSYEAGEAAYLGEKIKCDFAERDGVYIMRGALIYGRNGRDLVGEAHKVHGFNPTEWTEIDIWSDM